MFGFADAGAGEEDNLDAGGYAPAFFAFKSECGEGLGEGLAEAEPVEQVEGYALRLFDVDGLGEELEGSTRRGWVPTWLWL